MTSLLSTIALAAALAFSIISRPGSASPPTCEPDCTTVVYIARYAAYLPVQTEYLPLLPCLNEGACVLWEDGSIGPRPR